MTKKDLMNRKDHFSIRKLTVGAASVLIGVSLFGVMPQTNVQAAEEANPPITVNGKNTQEDKKSAEVASANTDSMQKGQESDSNQGNKDKTAEVNEPAKKVVEENNSDVEQIKDPSDTENKVFYDSKVLDSYSYENMRKMIEKKMSGLKKQEQKIAQDGWAELTPDEKDALNAAYKAYIKDGNFDSLTDMQKYHLQAKGIFKNPLIPSDKVKELFDLNHKELSDDKLKSLGLDRDTFFENNGKNKLKVKVSHLFVDIISVDGAQEFKYELKPVHNDDGTVFDYMDVGMDTQNDSWNENLYVGDAEFIAAIGPDSYIKRIYINQGEQVKPDDFKDQLTGHQFIKHMDFHDNSSDEVRGQDLSCKSWRSYSRSFS